MLYSPTNANTCIRAKDVASRVGRGDRDAEVGRIDGGCLTRFDDEALAALNPMKNFAAQSKQISRYIVYNATS